MRVLLLNKRKELEIEQRRLQAHRPSSAGRGELAPPPPPAQGPTEGRAENSASPSHEPGSRPGPTPGSSTGRGGARPCRPGTPVPLPVGRHRRAGPGQGVRLSEALHTGEDLPGSYTVPSPRVSANH